MKFKNNLTLGILTISLGLFINFSYIKPIDEYQVIDYPGARETIASSINSDGVIVGRYESYDSKTHGFKLYNGNFESVDIASADFTMVRGLNDKGDMVGAFKPPKGPNTAYIFSIMAK